MGEAKRRRIGKHAIVLPPREGLDMLGVGQGTRVAVAMIGAGLIARGLRDGTLQAKLQAREVTSERHLLRNAFSTWDRVRTCEYSPWECVVCARTFSGLTSLSCLAIIDHPADPPTPDKPALVCLVCAACDGVSTAATYDKLGQALGLMSVQQGRA